LSNIALDTVGSSVFSLGGRLFSFADELMTGIVGKGAALLGEAVGIVGATLWTESAKMVNDGDAPSPWLVYSPG